MLITSLQNPRIKALLKLASGKTGKGKGRLVLVEGLDEIRLALNSGDRPETVVKAPELAKRALEDVGGQVLTVNRAVFAKLSYRENPDGWIAVFPAPRSALADLKLPQKPLLIIVEALEKPGNLGAILRTADAAGVDAVIVCDERADVHGPNVVRASRGTLFSVPIAAASNAQALAFLRERGIRVLAATPNAGATYTDQDLSGALAIAVGTEDKGLTQFWLEQADLTARIPMFGKVNSLNVSVATALIVYEALRQRQK
jgi:TrmH family RNA methyltransferase